MKLTSLANLAIVSRHDFNNAGDDIVNGGMAVCTRLCGLSRRAMRGARPA